MVSKDPVKMSSCRLDCVGLRAEDDPPQVCSVQMLSQDSIGSDIDATEVFIMRLCVADAAGGPRGDV